MTIYIVQYTTSEEVNGDQVPKRFASSSYTNAKAFFNDQRKTSYAPDSTTTIGEENEALTKHVISGQKEVIDLINSLN